MVENVNFVDIALPLIQRGFRCTVVHPLTKSGVMKNWQNWQITTPEELNKYAGGKYAHYNVGVVGKRGVGRDMFLDIDSPGVIERIRKETGFEIPDGYRVQSSPLSKPWKIHVYLKQTKYSFDRFGGWDSVNSNVRNLCTLEDGVHPTLYDLKGVGGGSFVVGAGSVKASGDVYTGNELENVPKIPDWLVDWLITDIAKYWDAKDAEMAAKLELKRIEREKYTSAERADMRKQNLPEGFNILFEDHYDYLRWQSFHFSQRGLHGKVLEDALIQIAEDEIAGGRDYIQTDDGKAMIQKLAHHSKLETGDGSWFYKKKEKHPTGVVKVIHQKQSLVDVIFEIVRNFPERCLPTAEAYERIENALLGTGLDDAVHFDRTKGCDRKIVNRAMKMAGFEVDGRTWVRCGFIV